MSETSVRLADWKRDNKLLRQIRETVFVQEQAVPPEMEWDSEDDQAIHFLALEGEYAIGTARLLKDGKIGRVAVLKDWRGLQIGTALIQAALAEAERLGMNQQTLSAQIPAIAFYERFGFSVTSKEYLEAGIAHVDMTRHSPPSLEPTINPEKHEVRFDTPDTAIEHILALLKQARRTVCIYTPDLEPLLYNRSDIEHLLTQFLIAHPRNQIKLLVKDTNPAIKQGHRLINLSRRLSSNFHIRKRSPNYPAEELAYLLVDDKGLVIRKNPQFYNGAAYYSAKRIVRLQQNRFDMTWQTAVSDPNMRSMLL